MKLKWNSVISGGKPYFWHTKVEGESFWVVWNRAWNTWEVKGGNIFGIVVKSPKQGKDYIQSLVDLSEYNPLQWL